MRLVSYQSHITSIAQVDNYKVIWNRSLRSSITSGDIHSRFEIQQELIFSSGALTMLSMVHDGRKDFNNRISNCFGLEMKLRKYDYGR